MNLHATVDREFFGDKIFSLVKFSAGFIFVPMTTRQYKLSPFICGRLYFFGLIFVVEGDRRKFLRAENFPNYSTLIVALAFDP